MSACSECLGSYLLWMSCYHGGLSGWLPSLPIERVQLRLGERGSS